MDTMREVKHYQRGWNDRMAKTAPQSPDEHYLLGWSDAGPTANQESRAAQVIAAYEQGYADGRRAALREVRVALDKRFGKEQVS